MKTAGLFVNVNNIYYTVNKIFEGRKLNYDKLIKKIEETYTLYRAFAYGTQSTDEATSFIAALKYYGYEPKYKSNKKADWNVGLTLDVVRIIEKLDTVILGSSDLDLLSLVEWVEEKGRICIVYACNIPRDLKEQANKCIEIDESLLEELVINK